VYSFPPSRISSICGADFFSLWSCWWTCAARVQLCHLCCSESSVIAHALALENRTHTYVRTPCSCTLATLVVVGNTSSGSYPKSIMPENLKLSPVRCTHADVRCSWGRASYIRRSSQTRNTYTQLVSYYCCTTSSCWMFLLAWSWWVVAEAVFTRHVSHDSTRLKLFFLRHVKVFQ
jgi:hypothetical protein